MSHTTRYGNTYTDQEWQEVQEAYAQEEKEATRFFELKDELIAKAAGFLNREFSDVPVNTWKKALGISWESEMVNPKAIQFTSEMKKERFEAASNWIASEMKKEGLL